MSVQQYDPVPAWERPTRIPERVTLCRARPQTALAGQRGTWKLSFELAEDIAPGVTLRLQLGGQRNNRVAFDTIQADDPAGDGYLTAHTQTGEALELREDRKPGTLILGPPKRVLPKGSRITVTLGDTTGGSPGVQMLRIRTLSKFFVIYRADPEQNPVNVWFDEQQQSIVGACAMHVLGGRVHHLRAYAPAQARPGHEITICVRPEDEHSNLSHQTIESIAVLLDGHEVESALERLPGSTAMHVRVPTPREGVLRFTVRDRERGIESTTNPMLCSAASRGRSVYWGMIHGHTEMSDGTGSLEYYFRQMRDEAGLDFAAPGDHDQSWETSDEMWTSTCDAVAGWNEPGRFVVFLGYEWAKWRRNGDGDRNVYYLHDHRPMYRSDDDNYPHPPDLFHALRDETAVIIPHHTGHSGNFCDWKDHDVEKERLVEIFQCRGSYECSEEDGNPVPERGYEPPVPEGYVSRALAMGWRAGFTAGGDDHLGHAGTDFRKPSGRPAYMAGLTAVAADELTRQSVWNALWERRTVATTGPRILLSCDLNGRPSGSELKSADAPEFESSRPLHVEFHGTAPADRIEIIRNNEVVHTHRGGGLDVEFDWTDGGPLGDILMPPARFSPEPFCFYYVRTVQTDGHVAWTSPIWIVGE